MKFRIVIKSVINKKYTSFRLGNIKSLIESRVIDVKPNVMKINYFHNSV